MQKMKLSTYTIKIVMNRPIIPSRSSYPKISIKMQIRYDHIYDSFAPVSANLLYEEAVKNVI